eukprot:3940736-Rhodomonas_salina.3
MSICTHALHVLILPLLLAEWVYVLGDDKYEDWKVYVSCPEQEGKDWKDARPDISTCCESEQDERCWSKRTRPNSDFHYIAEDSKWCMRLASLTEDTQGQSIAKGNGQYMEWNNIQQKLVPAPAGSKNTQTYICCHECDDPQEIYFASYWEKDKDCSNRDKNTAIAASSIAVFHAAGAIATGFTYAFTKCETKWKKKPAQHYAVCPQGIKAACP